MKNHHNKTNIITKSFTTTTQFTRFSNKQKTTQTNNFTNGNRAVELRLFEIRNRNAMRDCAEQRVLRHLATQQKSQNRSTLKIRRYFRVLQYRNIVFRFNFCFNS
jgi:hypothetical protein